MIFILKHAGDNKSGKTSIIQRYVANQYTEKEESSENTHSTPHKLPQPFTHTLKVPGRKEIVTSTFWEIPSNPLTCMKERYYADADAVIIGEIQVHSKLSKQK